MIFNRTHHYKSTLNSQGVKEKLRNQQLNVRNIQFDIIDRDDMLKIIPRAEFVKGVKTLPITHIHIKDLQSGFSSVKVYSKPRIIDVGGPYLVVVFCIFLVLGACVLYYLNPNEGITAPAIMFGIASVGTIALVIRMHTGYYDYVRKINQFVKTEIGK